MNGSIRLVCPRCRGTLSGGGTSWSCQGCRASYRGLRGIPDLRTANDIYLANSADWVFARRLDERYDHADFRELLEHYYDLSPEIPADLRRRQMAHILTAPERARHWLGAVGPTGRGPLLDLGCGTGSFLATVGNGARETWGIDIALRWLLVARKRLDEAGLSHVQLVCGCAERLPFQEGRFSTIIAGDVIEHVTDQSATLAEAHRVLVQGGGLFLASPNRFSLAPEPHVQVWGVGFLPRRWMEPYVRWTRGVDFRAIRTLGYVGWWRLLKRSPFGRGVVRAPGLPKAEVESFSPLKRRLAKAYNAAIGTFIGQACARGIGPLFHVVCRKGETYAAPRPIRVTLRGSTPRAAQRSGVGS